MNRLNKESKHQVEQIIRNIREDLRVNALQRTSDKVEWEKRIINPIDPKFITYGLKVSQIDKIVRSIVNEYDINFEEACEGFKLLMDTHNHDEKMAAISFINRYKRHFNDYIVELYFQMLKNNCDTWAFCDSSMIKVLGPYLAKKGNKDLANKIIEKWSKSSHLWVRRASMVIFLKITMIHKDFDIDLLHKLTERLLNDSEQYIQKGIGWMLKTCSKYKPKVIFKYLLKNQVRFTRATLRTACEKFPDKLKNEILKN